MSDSEASLEEGPAVDGTSVEREDGPKAKRAPIVWDKTNERAPDPEKALTLENEDKKSSRQGRDESDARGGRRDRDTDRRGERRERDYDRRESRYDRGRQDNRGSRHREPDRSRYEREEPYNGADRPRHRGSDRRERGPEFDGRFRRENGLRGREDRSKENDLPVARGRGALKGQAAKKEQRPNEEENAAPKEKKNDEGSKAGGAYIPPFRLALMMKESKNKTDAAYQRLTWDALRKSINGLVNKANAQNIRPILKELLSENLHRGRGLFCLSIIKSQVASPSYTPVFAALVSVIATRLPDVATLLVHRLVAQFKRAFKRNDRALTSSVVTFLCHLANQQVVPTLLVAEILLILLASKTDDAVELAATALKESGALLQDTEPAMLRMVMDEMRQILQEGMVEERVQYIIEGLFKTARDGFQKSGHPQIPEGLDLLEDDDKVTVNFDITTDVPDIQMGLNIFKADPDFEEHEKEYEAESKKWFDDESSDDEDDDDSDDDESEEEPEEIPAAQAGMKIQDQTDTNLINLRRTIYLTIMSSMDFEEAGHKLMKIPLTSGQEMEIVTMIIECCSQEKTYLKYYGFLAQRYCGHHSSWQAMFEDCFRKQYMFVHRLETNKLRNVGCFFAHLLATDSISWAVLDCIRITEDDTTSSSRIFIKILFQDLAENMGLESLNNRLQDPECLPWFEGIFPKDTPRNIRFSINFFTSIGLGGVTEKMREYLKELPKLLAAQKAAQEGSDSDDSSDSDSDSDSSSSDDSSDSDSSDSDSDSSSSSSSSSDDSDSSDNESSGTEVTDPPSKHRSSKAITKSPKLETKSRGQERKSQRREDTREPTRKRGRESDLEDARHHRSSERERHSRRRH